MDPDLYIFTARPEEINSKIIFDKLRNIDIVKEYQIEPFKIQNKKNYIFIIFIFLILYFLIYKNKKIFLIFIILILLYLFQDQIMKFSKISLDS